MCLKIFDLSTGKIIDRLIKVLNILRDLLLSALERSIFKSYDESILYLNPLVDAYTLTILFKTSEGIDRLNSNGSSDERYISPNCQESFPITRAILYYGANHIRTFVLFIKKYFKQSPDIKVDNQLYREHGLYIQCINLPDEFDFMEETIT